MIVYRVEHRENGIGPYVQDNCGHWDHHTDCVNHPNPFIDGIDFSYDNMCGFITIKSLFNWFDPAERAFLWENEYIVAKYECHRSDVRIGNKQVMFPLNSTKVAVSSKALLQRIENFDLESLWEVLE